MGKFMKKYNNKTEVGLELVRNGKLSAFIHESVVLEHNNWQKFNCKLRIEKLTEGDIGFGIAVQRNSILLPWLNQIILTMREEQELARLASKWLSPCSSQVKELKAKEYDVNYFAGLFLLVAVVSIALLFCRVVQNFYIMDRRKYYF